MDVSNQLHVPAALPRRKEPPVSTPYDGQKAREQVWTRQGTGKYLLLAGIEPRSYNLQSPVTDPIPRKQNEH
jgi:hypothetical protein